MNSRATKQFWEMYHALPEDIQERAKNAYFRFQENPYHSCLRFKRVHTNRPIYSVRITCDYRATGVIDDDTMVWFRIGSHTEYERLLKPVK